MLLMQRVSIPHDGSNYQMIQLRKVGVGVQGAKIIGTHRERRFPTEGKKIQHDVRQIHESPINIGPMTVLYYSESKFVLGCF